MASYAADLTGVRAGMRVSACPAARDGPQWREGRTTGTAQLERRARPSIGSVQQGPREERTHGGGASTRR